METRATYGVEIRPETLRPASDDWERPTGAEIRSVLTKAGLSGSRTAALLGIESGRTIRRWTADEAPIPYAAWAILCYEAGYGMIWK